MIDGTKYLEDLEKMYIIFINEYCKYKKKTLCMYFFIHDIKCTQKAITQ